MRWKWRIILTVSLLALFAANHAEHYFRAQRIRQQAQTADVPLLQVVSNAAGHNSIQIDEQTHRSGSLYFNTLESWAYSKETPAPCPQAVMEVNGRQVKLTGFMYPLQEAGDMKVFCLLRSTQTCCYGPRPQFNQYVFVEMSHQVKFERLAPVVVEGKFIVDPRPDEGYIYRMEGQSVRSAVPSDQPPSAEEFARQNNLPVFDFAPLEAAKTSSDKEVEIARLAAGLDGKQMVVQGFIVGKTGDSPVKVMIGKYAWDGKAKGTPPGLYNTVLVSPKTAGDMPPVWWQEAVFKGTVHVTQDAAQRGKNGIANLKDATLAVAPDQGFFVDRGPMMPVAYEFMIMVGYAGMVLMRVFSRKSSPVAPPSSAGEEK